MSELLIFPFTRKCVLPESGGTEAVVLPLMPIWSPRALCLVESCLKSPP
jgi:hypothetical protein